MQLVRAMIRATLFPLAFAVACGGADDTVAPPLPAGWQSVEDLGAPGGFAPAVASSPGGDLYLAYYADRQIWARRWVAARATWDPLVPLTAGTRNAANPVIAVDDSGNALVAWWPDLGEPIPVARFSAAAGWPGGWSTTGGVAPGAVGHVTSIAMTGDGAAAMIWTANDGVHAAVSEDGRSWGAPAHLSPTGGLADVPAIALAHLGDRLQVAALWSEGSQIAGDVMQYSLITHSGAWSGGQPIDSETGHAMLPVGISIDAAGRVLAVYRAMNRETGSGELKAVAHTATWSAPERVTPVPTASSLPPAFAGEPGGDAIVAWTACSTECTLMTRRFVASAWQAPQVVATTNSKARVALSGDHALLVWSQRDQAGGIESMWGAHFDGSAWSGPQLLEHDDGSEHGLTYAVTLRRGHAGLAAWVRAMGSERTVVGALFGDD